MLQVAKAAPPFTGGVEAEWTQPPQVHPKGLHGRAVAIALQLEKQAPSRRPS